MILTCPQCATRYQTDAAQFPADGRRVRCAKCGHVWHQTPPPIEPEPGLELARPSAAAAGTAPEIGSMRSRMPGASAPVPEANKLRPPAGQRAAIIAGWAGFAAILMLIGWSVVAYRETIASVWPQSATFYKAAGMPVNVTGIAITDVTSRREETGGQVVLTVMGKLVNVSGHELAVPQVEVMLQDSQKREVDRWNFSPSVSILRPGQKVAFVTRRANPPQAARRLEVTLAEAGG